MNIQSSKIKVFFIIAFSCYWLFVLFITFSKTSFSEKFKTYRIAQVLFPATYKMYTSTPKQITQSEYTFYKNGEVVKKVNVDSLYFQQMKTSFPLPTFKKDLKQHLMLYYLPNLDLGNDVYTYALDSTMQKEKSLQDFLLLNKRNAIYVMNQLNHAQYIYKEADSVELSIHRRFNEIPFDEKKYQKLAYWISDSIIIKQVKKIQHEK